MFLTLDNEPSGEASRPEGIVDRYHRMNVPVRAWVRRTKSGEATPGKDVFGTLVGLKGSFQVGRDNIRKSEITSVTVDRFNDSEIEVDCDGLTFHHLIEPTTAPFGIVGFFPEGYTPDDYAISSMGMLLAQHDDWALVKAFEWSQIIALSTEGELRPEGLSEPYGYRWTPVSLMDVPGQSSSWLIRWGLMNMAAKISGERRSEVLFDKKNYCLSSIEGELKKITNVDGKHSVVNHVVERKRAKRLVDEPVIDDVSGAGSTYLRVVQQRS